MFAVYSEENDLVKRIKVEANIILASTIDKDDQLDLIFNKFSKLIHIAANIDYGYYNRHQKAEDFTILVDLILGKPLSPLTFGDNEFYLDDKEDDFEVYFNSRYEHIRKDILNGEIKYTNLNAYNLIVKAFYLDVEMRQINIPLDYKPLNNKRIYITKGGSITGEYIEYCYIDIEKTLKNGFDVTIPINIPISVIRNKNYDMYTVEARDPNFGSLMLNYIVPILPHIMPRGQWDIRKYTKLKK